MRRNIYFNDQNDKLLQDLAQKYNMGYGEVVVFALQNLKIVEPNIMDKEWDEFRKKIENHLRGS